jgi:hypothetical protein
LKKRVDYFNKLRKERDGEWDVFLVEWGILAFKTP